MQMRFAGYRPRRIFCVIVAEFVGQHSSHSCAPPRCFVKCRVCVSFVEKYSVLACIDLQVHARSARWILLWLELCNPTLRTAASRSLYFLIVVHRLKPPDKKNMLPQTIVDEETVCGFQRCLQETVKEQVAAGNDAWSNLFSPRIELYRHPLRTCVAPLVVCGRPRALPRHRMAGDQGTAC